MTAALVVAVLVALDGTFVYVLDDPAIHLSLGRRLVEDGTWGVAAGSFESASSSPLWTVLVAPFTALGDPGRDLVPLVLNVVAGVAAVAVLSGAAVLRPGRRRPLDAAATVALVVVVLFLPGLALVGMEHTLHIALLLAALALLHRRGQGVGDRWPRWAPAALLVLATLTRFETAFVAAGLALGYVADDGLRRGGRRAAAVLAASGLPIVAFGLVNRAMGGGFLPNSVLAKGQGVAQGSSADGLAPIDIVGRLTQDPLVASGFVLAVAYLVVTWGGPASARLPAWTVAGATVGHAVFADIGWYERYQAYLLALGAYLALTALGELGGPGRRRALVTALVVLVPFGLVKVDMLIDVPRAAGDMHAHQYQAARFLDRYYDEAPVASDQLGYISLRHDGPITDFGGLGDYEVLQAPNGGADSWGAVAERRGVRVAVVYDVGRVPSDWVVAGRFHIDYEPVTAVTDDLVVFATAVDEVEPLQDRLAEFAGDAPDGVDVRINENAALQVMAILANAGGT